MPELPEVENFKKYFQKHALNKEIEDVSAKTKSLVHKSVFNDFKNNLIGDEFSKAERRGKYLVAGLKNNPQEVVFHFGMTGDLVYNRRQEEVPEYSQVRFKFQDGGVLHYINKRMLGKIWLVNDISEIDALAEMGPEPLELSEKDFLDLLKKHERRNIKAFFMDQSQIAGIGNEYSDEILFRTKIDPHRGIKSLSSDKRKELYRNMKKTLQEAIKIGPPHGEFNSSWLLSHRGRSEDMSCPNNKSHKLKKETIAGRSSVYCPECQK